MKKILLCLMSLVISGCASFGEGVTTAFLNKQKEEDLRECRVDGKPFAGMQGGFDRSNNLLKVLMVHGVGTHIPGYSTQFQEKLAKELGLNEMSSHYKEIKLVNKEYPDQDLGTLRVRRLLDTEQDEEMLFYELTWSSITNPQKETLKYDTSGEYSFRRAEVNQMLKVFSNDTSPDPMIYLSEHNQDVILASYRTAFCWMVGRDWNALPNESQEICTVGEKAVEHLPNEDFAIVSHSLGSRIVIDGMKSIVSRVSRTQEGGPSFSEAEFIRDFQQKKIPFYLMSNQLPLLEMGAVAPEVVNQHDEYCEPGGEHYDERLVAKTSIIAFSDPNDLLSYSIPQKFGQQRLDSRLCAEITNVNINVAYVIDLFGMGSFANPLIAHTGYDNDDRVVALIAKGIGTDHSSNIVNDRCEWIEYVD
ncbi:MAG: hypothetical protein HOM15_02075 [Gammaproteobacteria bacterium]|nr:hypothetical protein [Gammaproteobacteria bacterium]